MRKHKHQWRKVGAVYSKDGGLRTTKKRCIVCGEVKETEEAMKG